ncbi:hypothetical protein SAMD00019534_060200 [Acytostelium subglobosum LB1]|uniref:hypothetical protein n=1 Tax=Acytostelium subglobosum LB1 TaxID=1410327 RepID=UPI0006448448|nr:hypothetical protein SAMD00019534_060200 [Acytostelium subglobosum LB1]GAM22845.1 hypothetical protein SAMD00019534_060200 [Acytostelium subglobosum LB1]|eukprot:XP_012754072.1 hypothetical protein SAMD00019534_060200 [Acytostelium subglobosum LB1]
MSSKKLLFDQFLLVSLKEDTNGAGGIIPYVKDVYPPDTVDPNVPLFCFPEEIDKTMVSYQSLSKSSSISESFSFVLTDREGNQQFGFTRRILTKANTMVLNKTTMLIPESLCIISRYAWYSTFAKMLEILESRYLVSIEEIHNFLAAALLSVIPAPGDNFNIHIYNNPFLTLPEKRVELPSNYQLKRPLDVGKSSLHDGTLFPLVESLSSQKILHLFISLLFERRVIIYSENICKVSKFVNAAVALLDPFVWQHIFIPVLPRSLLDYCTAPMPFIIGVHSSLFPLIRKKPLNEIIFVDLDKDQVLPLPEDIALFPPHLNQLLKQCLDSQILELRKSKTYDSNHNKIIVDTFRRFFVQILGTYRRFFLKDMEQKKMIFDKPSFIDSQLITPSKFLTTFCSSQMFERFIAEREEYYFKNLTPPGIFEKEVITFDLKNPVTASINNTLRQKEKEKEKERERVEKEKERERVEKEKAKALAKAAAYRQVIDLKKPALANPKNNGSVDRSFFANLISTNNNSNTHGAPTNNNNHVTSGTSSLTVGTPNISRSKTMTAADLAAMDSSNPQSFSALNVDLPKPKSSNNLAALGGLISNAANSITRSASTSFTQGQSHSPMSSMTSQTMQASTSTPSLSLAPPPQTGLSLSANSTPVLSHSKSISEVGHIIINQVAKTVTATANTVAHVHVNTGSHQRLTNSDGSQRHIQSLAETQRMEITYKSIPFAFIHQKFAPQCERMTIEDIHNLLFPPKQVSPTIPHIIKTPSSPELQRKEGGGGMHKSASVDKNLFKIPELPEHFAIPLNIKHRPRTTSQNNNNNIQPSYNNVHINPNYSVSDKSTLPSLHVNKRSHQRSMSVSTSSVNSSTQASPPPVRLTTSQQHQSPPSTFQLPPPPQSHHTPIYRPIISPPPQVASSASVQSTKPMRIDSPPSTQRSYSKQSSDIPPLSVGANSSLQSSSAASAHNPLPPLSSTSSSNNNDFYNSNPLSTPIETSFPTPVVPASNSSISNNFFSDCSPLGVPTSAPVVGIHNNPIAQSGENFFSPFISPMAVANNVNVNVNPVVVNNNVQSPTVNVISTSASSVLPPLLNNSGLLPTPSTSSFSTNFFDQSPLSQSSFSDFGPPASSIGSYNQLASTHTPPHTILNTSNPSIPNNSNPLPPLQTSYPTQQQSIPSSSSNSNTASLSTSGGAGSKPAIPDDMDEFDLFLAMRNQKK